MGKGSPPLKNFLLPWPPSVHSFYDYSPLQFWRILLGFLPGILFWYVAEEPLVGKLDAEKQKTSCWPLTWNYSLRGTNYRKVEQNYSGKECGNSLYRLFQIPSPPPPPLCPIVAIRGLCLLLLLLSVPLQHLCGLTLPLSHTRFSLIHYFLNGYAVSCMHLVFHPEITLATLFAWEGFLCFSCGCAHQSHEDAGILALRCCSRLLYSSALSTIRTY